MVENGIGKKEWMVKEMTEQSIFDTLQLLLTIIDNIYTETFEVMKKNPKDKEIHEKIEKAMVRVIDNFDTYICKKYVYDLECFDRCPLYEKCFRRKNEKFK